MSIKGYQKELFPNLQGQIFDCLLCSQVARNPKECSSCGNMFCGFCIDDYKRKNNCCPNRCPLNSISNMASKALVQIYQDLDINCENCKKLVKLGDIDKHQQLCGRSSCWNNNVCGGFQNKSFKDSSKPVCSEKCKLLLSLIQTQGNVKQMYELLKKISPKSQTLISKHSDKLNLQWNDKQCGLSLQFSADKSGVFLKQEPYIFRSAVTAYGFTEGRHYWEIHADSRTQNELKIGVTSNPIFDFNTAFCDHKTGFAFYGLAQLRQGSNATGPQYGKRFKKTGVLGVFLNMNRGELSFSLNGEDLGVAFSNQALTFGPLYPAVALLHCSGCTIKGQLPIPKIFQNR